MCTGPESEARPHENRRTIKRMDQLGYDILPPIPGAHPLDGSPIWLYTVQDYFRNTIAILAESDGLLIVTQMYTVRDSRPLSRRPLASDILLSFWKHVAQQPVESLRGIMFQTIEEESARDARNSVYHSLGEHRTSRVFLRRDDDERRKRQFNKVHHDTKLGRSVRTMTEEYIEMKEVRAVVNSFEFIPQGPRGRNFHLVAMLAHQRRARHR